jgi:hypothetical protein
VEFLHAFDDGCMLIYVISIITSHFSQEPNFDVQGVAVSVSLLY